LDIIPKSETNELLRPERRRASSTGVTLFTTAAERDSLHQGAAAIELKRQVAYLAIEAYRRRLTNPDDIAAIARKLHLSGLTAPKLLELAEAAR
jgi:hypothetical protein